MKKDILYSKNVVEFATVAREYCRLAENVEKYTKADFIKVASRMLPLLYLKASVLPDDLQPVLDDDLEDFVDEYTYETVRSAIRRKLTRHDDYLEVFKDDMHLSDEPIVANISEDMADIYQDLYNFCEQYSMGVDEIMNDSLCTVVSHFRTYWGQRLCNAQRALHSALFGTDDLDDEKPLSEMPDDDDDAWDMNF